MLRLIRDEKNKIGEKMRALKKSNENYRRLCEPLIKNQVECGVNTEEIIRECS